MTIKKWFYALAVIILFTQCNNSGEQKVLIETEFGNMTVLLYDETPKHRDNFIKLVEEGFYDDLLFHRVIKNFMIQGGDPDSRDAAAGQMLGQGGPGYTIPAEIGEIHYKGALSAARLADQVNPEKESSGSQFFIVQGTAVQDAQLDQWAQQSGVEYTPEQRKIYREIGGYPYLDGQYTVFGEVIDGLDVIDKIANVQVGQADRPIEDIRMKITLL